MVAITVVRTPVARPEGLELEGVRKLLFQTLDGVTDQDRKSWRRFWRRLMGLEPGEYVQCEMRFPRNGAFHRKLFALLTVGFEAWEPGRKHKTHKGVPVAKNFEQFREDITILAGYYEQTFDLRGLMKLRAKSISFANMEQSEFESLYGAVADVLLARVLHHYAGSRAQLDEVVERLMGFVQ